MESAMTIVLEKVARQLDFVLPFQSTMDIDDGSEAESNPSLFRTRFLHALVKRDLLSPFMAKVLYNDWKEDGALPSVLLQDSTGSIEEVVERLLLSGPEEQRQVLALFLKDYDQQGEFAKTLHKAGHCPPL
ncbi:hypothetical protein FRC19_007729 [Serendipita sp. 401]|nr:hypothetical protein FRC19_007729 [Serendipita sp. 401]